MKVGGVQTEFSATSIALVSKKSRMDASFALVFGGCLDILR